MHDISDLDRRGVPGVFVASAPFVDAAETQSAALGFEAPKVIVEHPIQDRTDDEMRVIAAEAFDEVEAALTATET